jgi:LacI family transcriptional regulator, galactose operon repressor
MTQKSTSVTIRDVARRAGVSVATVSRYINQNAPVSPEVADRLHKVMTDLRYVPHATARQLATRKTGTLGLILTNMHNDFFGPLLGGIEAVIRKQGYGMLVATSHIDPQQNGALPIGPHNTDGMLVFADSVSDRDLAGLYANQFPMVLIHRTPPPYLPIPSVTVENKAATRKLIDHLIEHHKKRKILFMRGPINQEDTHWRENGYKSALEAHDIPFDPALILHGEFERDVAYAAIKDFLSNGRRIAFDAVFTGDDDAALGVMNALQENGYKIPEEIAVAGFDDSRLSAYLTPPLTTVRAPTADVGRMAAQQLLNLIAGQTVEPVTLLPTEIIIRRSCGCPA